MRQRLHDDRCIVLSGVTGTSSNYPDAAVVTAFNTAAQGSLAVGTGSVTYGAYATLMSMRSVNVYGGGTGVIQTWQVTAAGTVPGAMPATVEVTGTLERQYVDAQTFAIFATGTGCGAVSLNGNVSTDSYDSSVGPATTPSGGNIGTNGNLDIVGHVGVQGSLSSPRTGVGACVNGSGVTALTETGAATVTGSVIQLPQALIYQAPALPSPMPPTTTQSTAAGVCGQVSLPSLCSTLAGVTTIDPVGSTVRLGNVTFGSPLVLKSGNYAINSISGTAITMSGATPVVINLTGKTSTGTDMANPISLGSQTMVNSSLDPSKLQILYAGTGTLDMTGGSTMAAMVYAPNATFSAHGNADFYGSILAASFNNAGIPTFHYDRHLQNTFFTMGNYVMTSFSWKKY